MILNEAIRKAAEMGIAAEKLIHEMNQLLDAYESGCKTCIARARDPLGLARAQLRDRIRQFKESAHE